MSSFFHELERRKVYRVAVAYVIAGGGLIQLASAVFPAWELPIWALRFVVVLLLMGFPIALVLAWAFDVTPDGIQTTPASPAATDVSSHRRRNILLLALLGLAISAAAGFFLLPRAAADRGEKSIAVLPFQNLSDEKENAFFADGIQDDILTSLAKIGDLKVISRTSVMPYRDKPASVRDLGRSLGVSAVLEGSVRKIGQRVRVNVQLINVANDQHIWAEEYDRELTDVFAIQSDLAQKIARELNAQLSPSEQAHMLRKPTENDEAYMAFVQAHSLQSFVEDLSKLKQAQLLYERAVELDPKFALAVAGLSTLHSWMVHNFEPTAEHREKAKHYAELALRLQPDLPEAHLARGYYLYYGEANYAGALEEFARAQKDLPNDSGIYLAIGAIQRRQGKWAESTATLTRAVDLNPNDFWPLQNLFFNYQMQRDFDAAFKVLNRALELSPESFSLRSLQARTAAAATGNLSVAEKNLQQFAGRIQQNPTNEGDQEALVNFIVARASVFVLERKYPEVIAVTDKLPAAEAHASIDGLIGLRLFRAIALQKLGRREESRAILLEAKAASEEQVRAAPNDPGRHSSLAGVLAYLGEKEAAIAEAQRAVALRPDSIDAFEGPGLVEALAQVYAITGENARALETIDSLLSRPGNLTVPLLRLDPIWDGLRSDPGFEKVLAKHERKP